MKKHIKLTLFLALFSFVSANLSSQVLYKVSGSSLNVREEPTTDSKAFAKLNQGDEIMVLDTINGWARVEVLGKFGYVNVNFIKLISTSENATKRNKLKSANSDNGGWLVLGLIVSLFLWITYIRYSKKCMSCKKWNVMRKTRSEIVETKQSTVTKIETITDTKGVKHTNKHYLPATTTYYHIHRQCKRCGKTDYIKKDEQVLNS